MIKSSFTLFSLMILFSKSFCQQTVDSLSKNDSKKILEVSYNYGGGEPGFDMTFTIREDSILYREYYYSEKLGKSIDTSVRKPNTSPSWLKLVKTLNISEFFKLKGGYPTRQFDGVDYEIIVRTLNRDRHLILSTDNYNEMKVFLAAIELEFKKIDRKFKVYGNLY